MKSRSNGLRPVSYSGSLPRCALTDIVLLGSKRSRREQDAYEGDDGMLVSQRS